MEAEDFVERRLGAIRSEERRREDCEEEEAAERRATAGLRQREAERLEAEEWYELEEPDREGPEQDQPDPEVEETA